MANNSTTIQLRIDKKTKEQAQKIFTKLGMDISSGMKIYLNQVVQRKGIPFKVLTENGFTPEYEKMLIRETEWAKKHGKRFSSVEELMKDLES